jgi:hypothetical protein
MKGITKAIKRYVLAFFSRPKHANRSAQDAALADDHRRHVQECVTPFARDSELKADRATLAHRAESNDPEFDDHQRNFGMLEKATEKLLKDSKIFTDAVTGASHAARIVRRTARPV